MKNMQDFTPNDALPQDCEELFRQMEHTAFDLTQEWFNLLARTTLSDPMLARFSVLFESGEAQAVLPISLPRMGVGLRQVTGLTNFYSTIYRPVMRADMQVPLLAKLLRKIVQDTHVSTIRFDAMDPLHSSFSLLENALRHAGMLPFRFFCHGNWYLPANGLSWDAYLKKLPSKQRNTLKRLGRKFEEEVEGSFRILTGQGNELDEAISAYQIVYAASWKVPEPYPNFIPEFIKLSAQLGWLRMGVAYAGKHAVAAQFWLVLDGKASIYKVAYDEKFAAYSPGSLLTGQLMRHVLDTEHVREVDFLIGDDSYKQIWMSDRRERWGIVAYNPRTLVGIGLALRESASRVLKPAISRLRDKLQKKSPLKS